MMFFLLAEISSGGKVLSKAIEERAGERPCLRIEPLKSDLPVFPSFFPHFTAVYRTEQLSKLEEEEAGKGRKRLCFGIERARGTQK